MKTIDNSVCPFSHATINASGEYVSPAVTAVEIVTYDEHMEMKSPIYIAAINGHADKSTQQFLENLVVDSGLPFARFWSELEKTILDVIYCGGAHVEISVKKGRVVIFHAYLAAGDEASMKLAFEKGMEFNPDMVSPSEYVHKESREDLGLRANEKMMISKFGGKCSETGEPFKAGTRIAYNGKTKTARKLA